MTGPSRDRLRIGVMGAGAIGCYVGGRLAAAGQTDVTFVGRAWFADEVAAHGLTVRDLDGEYRVDASRARIETSVDALSECDVVFCCVKSLATPEVASALAGVLRPGAVVVSLQNGVRNPEVLRERLPEQRVVAGIVGFNVVVHDGGVFHQTTTGPIVVEAMPDDAGWVRALASTGLDVEELDPIAPEQWTKLLINLNNAISALSNAPTREMILSPRYRTAMTMLLDEALSVLDAAGIPTAKFRGVPLKVMSSVLKLPTPIVRVVVRAQLRVDPEARSSMWQDLERHRLTEVDFLNGEIVRLARSHGVEAPLNQRIVDLVHEAERADQGSPRMSADALVQSLRSALA